MPGRKYLEENLRFPPHRLTTVWLIDLHMEGGRAACSRIEQFLSKLAIVSKGGDDRDVCVYRNHSHGVIGL